MFVQFFYILGTAVFLLHPRHSSSSEGAHLGLVTSLDDSTPSPGRSW